MKDCDIIQPELSAYVDGELAMHRREIVEAHLASCPNCQTALAELKTIATGVAGLPKLDPPPGFLADVRHKIARGNDPEALTWRDHLFRPFWIKVPLELAALVAVTIFVTRLQEQPAVEPVASEQLAQAEGSVNDQSPVLEKEARSEQPTPAEPVSTPQPPVPSTAPENQVTAPPTGESSPSQEAAVSLEKEAVSSGEIASEPGPGAEQQSASRPNSAIAGSRVDFKPSLLSKRRMVAANRGSGGWGAGVGPSAAAVAAMAQSVGIEPAKVAGVVVVQAKNLNVVRGQAEQLASRCNGKVISVVPSTASTGQIFFVELPREYAASFQLDLEQSAASPRLSTTGMIDKVAAVTTNAPPLSATSTARVVGVLTGGIETNGLFSSSAQLTLANNPRAQAAATTVLEILVVPPPGLTPTNITSRPASPRLP
jgi:hypothetical protein